MRRLSEPQALVQLRRAKQGFSKYINEHYTHKAKDCRTCDTVCCADADFVNVNITRLEAVAIWNTLKNSPRISSTLFENVLKRAAQAIEKYRLSDIGDTFQQTYSCPLFENGIGCLVHWKAKPAPCIQHGCYEDWHDLPDTLQFSRVERQVENLNERVYPHKELAYATIPIWLMRIAEEMGAQEEAQTAVQEDAQAEIQKEEQLAAQPAETETAITSEEIN